MAPAFKEVQWLKITRFPAHTAVVLEGISKTTLFEKAFQGFV